MTTWNYTNTSVETTLSSTISAVATSMTVASVSGWPVSFPYTAVIDYGASNLEVVNVTAAVGTTLTITRGQDGTSADGHAAGAVVVHALVARDAAEPQAHIAASTGVHGLAGGVSVVGTTSSQTLTNKTLTSPTINGPVMSGGTVTLNNQTVLSIKDGSNFQVQAAGDSSKVLQLSLSGLTTATTRTLTIPDANTTVVGTDATQTVTNKTLGNTNTVTVKDTLFTIQDDGDATKQVKFQASGVTTGTTRTLTVPDADLTVVGLTTTQTLTNKSLTSPTITGTGTAALSTLSVNSVSYTELGAAWTSYTPAYSASGGGAAIGNGTLTGAYKQVGKTVWFRIKYVAGTTTTYGSGFFIFTLPFTAISTYALVCTMHAEDSGTAVYACSAYNHTTGAFVGVTPSNVNVGATAPFTWGTADTLAVVGTYEIA